jgi:type IV secretory pathway TrbL component
VNDFGTLDTVLNNFTSAIAGTWGPQLFFYLQPVLFAIIVLQLGLVAVEATVQRDIPLLLSHMMMGLFRIGVVWSIFTYGFSWANSIVQTGQVLGSNISGFGLTPSGVFDNGISVMQTIFNTKAAGSWYIQLFEDLEFFLVGVFVMLCWAAASVIYLGALIEAALLVYVGPLIIAFTPLSWTFEMLLLWGRSLLGIAFKSALILMTLALGMVLANQWTAAFTASSSTFTTDIWNLLIGVVEAILFAYCVWKVPNRISGLTAGAAFIGFGEAVLGMAASGADAAYGALSSRGSSNNSGSSGSGGSGNSAGGGSAGSGGAGSSGGNASGQQAAQQMAAKVHTALTQG